MKIIVYDFEVFKYDTLLGAIILENDKPPRYFQTWDKDEIRLFYESNKTNIWVGHNNQGYDDFILDAIVNKKNEYKRSKDIVENHVRPRKSIKLYSYDLTCNHFESLKTMEAFMGKNISETEVDFDLNRQLTDKEKEQTESYNRDDLDQTLEDLKFLKDEFQLRLELIKEFDLPLTALSFSTATIAARILKANKIDGIDKLEVLPTLYPNLNVSNKRVIDFYMNREWARKKTLKMKFCGTEHNIASGGIHAGDTKHIEFAYYLDVSGYYNLIMIKLNLLPRSIPEESKKLYEYMYHEQLRLKKINPVKRGIYKTICLSVFGAQNNENSDFYDPHQGDLVRLSGEMFLIDLLEKLEGKVENIQSNTDGIMVKLINGTTEQQLKEIVDEWQERTGFTLKFDKIYDIIQRDVNNYMYRDEYGNIHVKGEAVKHYNGLTSPYYSNAYKSKEPIIIAHCIVEYYMNHRDPEQVIEEYKDNLRMFQYICKKLSYDYLTYEFSDETGYHVEKLQKVNRAFALKSNAKMGMIYKCKNDGSKQKVSNLPDNVFVYNENILDNNINLKNMIDYNYYIKRAKERIGEFELKNEQLTLF